MAPIPATTKPSCKASTITDDDTIQALLDEAEKAKKIDQTQSRNRPAKVPGNDTKIDTGRQKPHNNKRPRDDYYGNQSDKDTIADEKATDIEKKKPDFGLSGALLGDTSGKGGTIYKGVVLKFQEPLEARTPNTQWR